MGSENSTGRESWNGQIGFILAATGSAIGLGNIWKFPYVTGTNGGGAFILVYLGCILMLGIPMMLCELAIGRKTQRDPFGAFRTLQPTRSSTSNSFAMAMIACGLALLVLNRYVLGGALIVGALGILKWGWGALGVLGVVIPVLILSFYNVVGGWLFVYVFEVLRGSVNFAVPEESVAFFETVTGNWKWSLGFMVIFGFTGLAVVWFGIRKGIERVSKVLMPLLFVMLVALILRSLTLPGSEKGVSFLLTPKFSELSAKGVLDALGHAFFTLSLGMGITITYGSYLSGDRNILGSSLCIVGLDTLVAIMAGLAIFPALFALGVEPDSGSGLLFKIMPVTLHSFGDGLGTLWTLLFFGLVSIAALTSSISLLEVPVSFCMSEFKWSRHAAALAVFTVVMLLGVLSAVSVDSWSNILWAKESMLKVAGEANVEVSFFEQLNVFSSSYLLPIFGLLTALFVGYVWKTRNCLRELRRGGENYWDTNILILIAGLRGDGHLQERKYIYTLGVLFGILIRVVVPLAIIVCFMNLTGWIDLT